jgi:hypothetical protein
VSDVEDALYELRKARLAMLRASYALKKIGYDEAIKHSNEIAGAAVLVGEWIVELTKEADKQ